MASKETQQLQKRVSEVVNGVKATQQRDKQLSREVEKSAKTLRAAANA